MKVKCLFGYYKIIGAYTEIMGKVQAFISYFFLFSSTGTHSDHQRENIGDYFESEIFHLPVWHCLQAARTGIKYIIDGNSFTHWLILSLLLVGC